MARYENGINGPVSGKVGSVIAASWRGIDYVKSKQKVSTKKPSEAQLSQRRVFAMVSSWLKPLRDLIWIGFQSFKSGRTPVNEAISFTLKEAIVADGSESRINFSKVVFSRGELFISWILDVLSLVDAVLYIRWDDAPASAFCRDSDQANFVVYNAAKEKFVTFEQDTLRSDKEVALQLPGDFSGDAVHCYMHYVSNTGVAVSTSQYLGEFVVG